MFKKTNIVLLLLAALIINACGSSDSVPPANNGLGAPDSGLQATSGDQRVTVTWDTVPGADSYNIYWSNTSGTGTSGAQISGVMPPFYHDGLTNGTDYYYVVTAVNVAGESRSSSEINATPVDIFLSSLSFNDANLAACVNDAVTDNGYTYVHELVVLDCTSRGIVELGGVEALTSLNDLTLYNNSISGLGPLSDLTNLDRLNLNNNSISNVTALSVLTGLTYLTIFDNSIVDLSPLSKLTNLTYLSLHTNNITDMSALSVLTSLDYLSIGGNSINDLNPLSSLNVLTRLYLFDNSINDVSPLSTLTSLTHLALDQNSITDLSPLSGLTNLTFLNLGTNNISDINPLSGLTNLNGIILSNNNVSDIGPLAGITGMTQILLDNNSIVDVSPLSSMTDVFSLKLNNNIIGGAGDGNVDALVTLTNLSAIYLNGNIGMSCSELDTLITALGSPPVDTDDNTMNSDVATDGVNCTNP